MAEKLSIELILFAIFGIVIIILIAIFTVKFIVFYYQRQRETILEKQAMRESFERELLLSQLETQNQTLQEVGEELHDNIGQMLTVISFRLNLLETEIIHPTSSTYLQETAELVAKVISDIRSISKTLDRQSLKKYGLLENLALELERVERTGRISTHLEHSGSPYSLNEQTEVVIMRMTQEAINNTLKHSAAKNLTIKIVYEQEQFALNITDDGKGFDMHEVSTRSLKRSGSGLNNLSRRAELLGAKMEIMSSTGLGSSIRIHLQI